MLRQLPWSLYGWLEEIITENQEDWGAIHPVVPNQVSKCALGYTLHQQVPSHSYQTSSKASMDI